MSETHKLDEEDQALLRSVLRKRQPSSLWLVSSLDQKSLTPAQRDSIKGVLSDEMRETGYGSDRTTSLKKLIDYFGQP
jgi:1,2-phenylacetyl-CoA epoxidase PaaB subunit